MNKADYITEECIQLCNPQFYEPTNMDLTGKVGHRVNLHIYGMVQRGQITEKACSYFITDSDGTQQFNMLPKINMNLETHLVNMFSLKRSHNLWATL